ncbi:MAG: hypothetical protein FJ264_04490 [Planctomycetes bacterium]|nr:hypothetical protein [Planctomycetota bacterium]
MNLNQIMLTEQQILAFERNHKKKARFFVDETLGSDVAKIIKDLGWDVVYIDDAGMDECSRENVFSFVWENDRVLLTQNHDFFLDNFRFPPHRNPGLVVLPGSSENIARLEHEIARVLVTIGDYRSAYKGFKICIDDKGIWTVYNYNCSCGSFHKRHFKFDHLGRIFELEEGLP